MYGVGRTCIEETGAQFWGCAESNMGEIVDVSFAFTAAPETCRAIYKLLLYVLWAQYCCIRTVAGKMRYRDKKLGKNREGFRQYSGQTNSCCCTGPRPLCKSPSK